MISTWIVQSPNDKLFDVKFYDEEDREPLIDFEKIGFKSTNEAEQFIDNTATIFPHMVFYRAYELDQFVE